MVFLALTAKPLIPLRLASREKRAPPGDNLKLAREPFARSTPRLTLSFSIAEMVDCGIPVSLEILFCVNPCSSRTIRTDSPTETVTFFVHGESLSSS